MNDKIFIFIPTCIKKEGKEGLSWQALLIIAKVAITSFFDNLKHENVEIVVSDDESMPIVCQELSNLVQSRYPKATIIRWNKGIGSEAQWELSARMAIARKADFWYFNEQDYFYTLGALEKALDAFYHMPNLNILALNDHPGKYRGAAGDLLFEEFYDVPAHYHTETVRWRKVNCSSATAMFRVSYMKENWEMFQKLANEDRFRDQQLFAECYKRGQLQIEPTVSVIQHLRYDHTQDSPTFPFKVHIPGIIEWGKRI